MTLTKAQAHIERYDSTGGGWEWLHSEAAQEALNAARQEHDPAHGTRYEWPDGSAVVVSGDGWDSGVHRYHLDDVQEILDAACDPDGDTMYEPAGCRIPAKFIWCGQDSEALPNAETARYDLPAAPNPCQAMAIEPKCETPDWTEWEPLTASPVEQRHCRRCGAMVERRYATD